MKKARFFIMAFVLVGIMFILSGCGMYYSDSFDFKFKGGYMADKYVDLLIPLDETDEFYTPYNCNIEGDIKIPEDSEIVKYNKDGYRSMLMHIEQSNLNISIYDSENYLDSHEKYNGTPFEIRQFVYVPCYGNYSNAEEIFLEFCDKYKKCHIAVFDKDGNILQISKKIPIVSWGNFYLQDISYDVEKNRIKPHYIESEDISYLIAELCFLSLIGTICCIITLIVYKINNGFIVSYKGYIIASSIFNIPTALFIITYIYCALGESLTIADFFTNLLTILTNMNIFLIIILINICILINFIQLEKKLRLKKSLDISENM